MMLALGAAVRHSSSFDDPQLIFFRKQSSGDKALCSACHAAVVLARVFPPAVKPGRTLTGAVLGNRATGCVNERIRRGARACIVSVDHAVSVCVQRKNFHHCSIPIA